VIFETTESELECRKSSLQTLEVWVSCGISEDLITRIPTWSSVETRDEWNQIWEILESSTKKHEVRTGVFSRWVGMGRFGSDVSFFQLIDNSFERFLKFSDNYKSCWSFHLIHEFE
jgi:hypothetical protein